ncbi:MAG TPA: glycerol-3-phosphate dehydrogenase/oxidase [Planctomycetota bacterium]|jgi:glycerol-3-phosphate dehydrogenase
MNWRAQTLQQLEADPNVSVLILGGGINGAGLFRELALQGVDCLLVDKADFTAGATSKSSRMIHGGLRYLENREFKLVAESLLERNLLLENASHYVSPLKTTIPLFSWFGGLIKSGLIFAGFSMDPGSRGVATVKVGLMFYDFVTRKNRRTPTHFITGKSQALQDVPGLNPNIVATATYWDAWITQAERLCLELIQDACRENPRCHALNYIALEGVKDGGVALRDSASGKTVVVKPKIVVNATGAWVDLTNASFGLKTSLIGGTKGSHLVVDNKQLHDALGGRMVYYQHSDGRVCIVFPFLGKVIMGSTDIRASNPEQARCDEAEIQYMLTTLRGVFENITITREQVVFSFCGVRPLPAKTGVTATISRGHSVKVIEPETRGTEAGATGRSFPIYCLVGGKWTTFRAFAEQVADRLLPQLGQQRRCSTEKTPIGGGKGCPLDAQARADWTRQLAQKHNLREGRASALFQRYGTAAASYAAKATGESERPFKSLPGYTVGEIEHIAANDYVEHLTDVIRRRSTISLLGDAKPEVVRELAEIVGRVLGWDKDRISREIDMADTTKGEAP